MAARLNKYHQDWVRDKIQASQLVNRLTQCAMGEVELTSQQIKAIEILLSKTIPDLKAVEVTGGNGGALKAALEVTFVESGRVSGEAEVPVSP